MLILRLPDLSSQKAVLARVLLARWQDGVMKKIIILGSTGSIGTQALEIIEANPDKFQVVGLAGNTNKDLLQEQGNKFSVPEKNVVIGAAAATELIESIDADVVINGITGSIGLAPTLATLRTGKRLALANKESLIVGSTCRRLYCGQHSSESRRTSSSMLSMHRRSSLITRIKLEASWLPLRVLQHTFSCKRAAVGPHLS